MLEEQDRILQVNIEEEMRSSYIDYSMSVIMARALPDVRDGFKPVHRRILYGMDQLGITHDKATKKCARIVGEVLGKYHPHGDSSVYGALVRMAQDWNMRYPLVEGQGNFGDMDGDGAAAMRYTEARLAIMGEMMMQDIEKDTVEMVNNFDDSLKEPSVLPTRIPSYLINGATGIAVGMATNVPTHNLSEVIDGCVAFIDNPDIDVDGLYSDFTHRGVRILSIGPKVERITVRNVHVQTYRDAVALTTEGGKGTFDEIVIRDVMSSATYEPEALYNSKAAWPIVHVDGGCDVGHLVIDNLCRTETCRAAHPTIGVSSGAKIEHLVIRDCRQVNETKDDMTFLTVHGKARIGKLELGDVSFASAPGAGRNVLRDDYAPCAGIFYTYAPNVRPATDVYLLLGRLDPVERGVPVERVRTFKDGKAWYEVKTPTFEKEDTPAARACRAFGRKLAAADPKAVIGFVPAAESNAVERVRKALERGGKLKGVLRLRGETDDSRLAATVAALRKEFGDVSVIKQVLE